MPLQQSQQSKMNPTLNVLYKETFDDNYSKPRLFSRRFTNYPSLLDIIDDCCMLVVENPDDGINFGEFLKWPDNFRTKQERKLVKAFFKNPVVESFNFDWDRISKLANEIPQGIAKSLDVLLFTLYDSYSNEKYVPVEKLLNDFGIREKDGEKVRKMLKELSSKNSNFVSYVTSSGFDLIKLKDFKDGC